MFYNTALSNGVWFYKDRQIKIRLQYYVNPKGTFICKQSFLRHVKHICSYVKLL